VVGKGGGDPVEAPYGVTRNQIRQKKVDRIVPGNPAGPLRLALAVCDRIGCPPKGNIIDLMVTNQPTGCFLRMALVLKPLEIPEERPARHLDECGNLGVRWPAPFFPVNLDHDDIDGQVRTGGDVGDDGRFRATAVTSPARGGVPLGGRKADGLATWDKRELFTAEREPPTSCPRDRSIFALSSNEETRFRRFPSGALGHDSARFECSQPVIRGVPGPNGLRQPLIAGHISGSANGQVVLGSFSLWVWRAGGG